MKTSLLYLIYKPFHKIEYIRNILSQQKLKLQKDTILKVTLQKKKMIPTNQNHELSNTFIEGLDTLAVTVINHDALRSTG